MVISQARISSWVGVFPNPYVGDCAHAAWQTPRTITGRRSLSNRVVDGPIAGHPPRLNGIVRTLHTVRFVIVRGHIKEFGHLSACRLNLAQRIRAARLQ